jgi:uncharacterized membrane protein HdeD (DUF308 family)
MRESCASGAPHHFRRQRALAARSITMRRERANYPPPPLESSAMTDTGCMVAALHPLWVKRKDRAMRSDGALLIITAVMFILLGLTAVIAPLFAGIAISTLIGGLLMVAGIAHIVSVLSRDDGGVVLHVALGLVYACAGAYFVSNPAVGLIALTLLLAVMLFVEAGIEMVAYSAQRREPGAPWLLVNAFVTALLGTLIAVRWPATAAWAIGTLIGLNLITTGVSRLMLGASVWRSLRALKV